jgi:hypothetical protein
LEFGERMAMVEEGDSGSGNGATPFRENSLIEQLRADNRELVENPEVFIPIPGYTRTGLQARYHLPESGKEIEAITRKVFREHRDTFSRNLYVSMDIMIRLCAGLYVQPPDSDDPVEFDPQLVGAPVQYDERLAEVLGIDPESVTARGVVRKLFGGNDLAIVAHAEKLDRWLRNTKADLTTDFAGLGEF